MLISDLHSSLISLQGDWSGIILNPNYIRKEWVISWNQFKHVSLGDRITSKTVKELEKGRQYSFQLFDGSLIQLYYRFREGGDIVQIANLAFYKCERDIYNEEEDDNGDISEYDDTPIEDYEIPWIRIDYCPDEEMGIIHAATHMHSSIGANVRLPINGIPTPKQFIEALMAWFYPAKYEEKHLDSQGIYTNPARVKQINRAKIPWSDQKVESIVHLGIPPIA